MTKYVLFSFITLVVCLLTLLTGHIACVMLCILWLIRVYKERAKWLMPLTLVISLCCFIRVQWIQQQSRLNVNDTQFNVVLHSNTIRVDGDAMRATGTIANEVVTVTYRLQTEYEKTYFEQLTKRLQLTVTGNLKLYEHARGPNQFDAKTYYFQQKRSFYTLEITRYHIVSFREDWRLMWQKHVLNRLSNDIKQLVNAFVFGAIDDKAYFEVFQNLGILHLFILSGMHIAQIFQWVTYCLLRIGITKEMVKRLLQVVACVAIYCFGWKVSIVKQCCYVLFYKQKKIDVLLCCGIAYLMANPYYLFSIGFQFAILFSLFYYLLENKRYSYSALCLLLSYHFFQINVLALVATRYLIQFFKCVLLPLAWIVALVPLQFWNILNVPLHYLYEMAHWMEEQRYLTIVTGRQEWYWYVLFVGVIVVSMYSKRQWLWLIIASLCLIPKPAQRFIMLDVGQGDSFVFQNGYDVLMVDTGGRVVFEPKEKWRIPTKKYLSDYTTTPILKSLGISHIHQLVLTHADSDHVGELTRLMEKLSVHTVIAAKGAPIPQANKRVLANDTLLLGNIQFHVLYPFEQGDGENEHSIVLWTHFLNETFLMTGDIGIKSEEMLIVRYPKLKASVLKAGHHGSKQSSSQRFIQHVAPKIVLFSSGRNNRFNHPHPDVLQRVKHTTMYRTDKNGVVIMDANNWYISLNE